MAEIYDFKNKAESKMVVPTRRIARPIPITTIDHIADLFLSIQPMTHKKLQKICYYAYAWYFALYNNALFENRFEAWIHGPVDPLLYQRFRDRGWQEITIENPVETTAEIQAFVNEIFESYGHLSGNELEFLTHKEDPWVNARAGLPEFLPSSAPIDDNVIRTYFLRVMHDEQRD
jgi:uncharacterized phage-associated protein